MRTRLEMLGYIPLLRDELAFVVRDGKPYAPYDKAVVGDSKVYRDCRGKPVRVEFVPAEGDKVYIYYSGWAPKQGYLVDAIEEKRILDDVTTYHEVAKFLGLDAEELGKALEIF